MSEEQIEFKVKGKSYSIDFPNVGKFRRIESLKQMYSLGTYKNLIETNIASSEDALDMIDIQSMVTVLCPKLLEDLKCEDFDSLGLLDYAELREAYKEQIVPWWNNILEILKPKNKEVPEDDK